MTHNVLDTYRVAAIQFEPRLGAKTENIARLLELTEAAAYGGARLIVHPEMATTGYCWYSRDEVRTHSDAAQSLGRVRPTVQVRRCSTATTVAPRCARSTPPTSTCRTRPSPYGPRILFGCASPICTIRSRLVDLKGRLVISSFR